MPYTRACVLSLSVAFGKPLGESTCEQLAKDSQASAERKSWWPFSRRTSSEAASGVLDKSGEEDDDIGNEHGTSERANGNGSAKELVPGMSNSADGTEHGTEDGTEHGTTGNGDVLPGNVLLPVIPPLGHRDVTAIRPGTETPTYSKTLVLTSEDLEKLNLHPGGNEAQFTVTSKMQGRATVSCNIYLWNHDENVVISDIDGGSWMRAC